MNRKNVVHARLEIVIESQIFPGRVHRWRARVRANHLDERGPGASFHYCAALLFGIEAPLLENADQAATRRIEDISAVPGEPTPPNGRRRLIAAVVDPYLDPYRFARRKHAFAG